MCVRTRRPTYGSFDSFTGVDFESSTGL